MADDGTEPGSGRKDPEVARTGHAYMRRLVMDLVHATYENIPGEDPLRGYFPW